MANGHGGARPGGGRKKGSTTQAKLDLVDLAKGYAGEALATLTEIARDRGAPPAARVSAAVAILDRGYGKPTQAVNLGGHDGGKLVTMIEIVAATNDEGDDPTTA